MNEIERRGDELAGQDWLTSDVESVRAAADRIQSRRRRYLASAVGAFALVFVVSAVVVAATRRGDSADREVVTAAQQQALDCATAAGSGTVANTILVTMNLGATPEEIGTTRTAIVAVVGGRRVEVHGQAENLVRLRSMYDQIPNNDLSSFAEVGASFTAVVAAVPAADLEGQLDGIRQLPGVSTVVTAEERCRIEDPATHQVVDRFVRSRWNGIDAIVFLDPAATPAQIDGLRAALKVAPAVAHLVYLNKDDSYREFSCLFRDSPEMIDSIQPEILPTSFRVTVAHRSEGEIDAVRAQIEHLPGVKRVVVAPSLDQLVQMSEAARAGGEPNPGGFPDPNAETDPACIPVGQPVK